MSTMGAAKASIRPPGVKRIAHTAGSMPVPLDPRIHMKAGRIAQATMATLNPNVDKTSQPNPSRYARLRAMTVLSASPGSTSSRANPTMRIDPASSSFFRLLPGHEATIGVCIVDELRIAVTTKIAGTSGHTYSETDDLPGTANGVFRTPQRSQHTTTLARAVGSLQTRMIVHPIRCKVEPAQHWCGLARSSRLVSMLLGRFPRSGAISILTERIPPGLASDRHSGVCMRC